MWLADLLLAEEVLLPESLPHADAVLNVWDTHEKMHTHLKNAGFPSPKDEPAPRSPAPADDAFHVRHSGEGTQSCLSFLQALCLLRLSFTSETQRKRNSRNCLPLAEDVLYMRHSNENMCADIRFLELDDEVTYFMSQPVVMACDVPLPPSPSPDNTAHHGRSFQEKKHPDFFFMCFASLDVEVPDLLPLSQLRSHCPPSPPPPDIVLDMGHSGVKKCPDLLNTMKMMIYKPVLRLVLFFYFYFFVFVFFFLLL